MSQRGVYFALLAVDVEKLRNAENDEQLRADPQVLLEIGHVFSDVRELRVTNDTSAPGATVDRPEDDVFRFICGGQSGRNDDALQVGAMDDERLAGETQAAALVQKDEPWAVEMVEMDHQRQLSKPGKCAALRTSREPFPDVRVQDERVSRRQQTHAVSIRLSTRAAHCFERHVRGWLTRCNCGPQDSRCRKIVLVEFDQTGDVLHEFRGQLRFVKHTGSHG